MITSVMTIFYYVVVYVTLFVSVFWFVVLFNNRKNVISTPKGNKKLPSVSLIIPVFNEEKTISDTLKSLLSLNYPKIS